MGFPRDKLVWGSIQAVLLLHTHLIQGIIHADSLGRATLGQDARFRIAGCIKQQKLSDRQDKTLLPEGSRVDDKTLESENKVRTGKDEIPARTIALPTKTHHPEPPSR